MFQCFLRSIIITLQQEYCAQKAQCKKYSTLNACVKHDILTYRNPFYSNTTYQLLLSLFRHFFPSRLLQMGVYNAELFTNLGLCCFFAQQYDMTLNCFERALSLASDENMADVWYNIGHVAVVK